MSNYFISAFLPTDSAPQNQDPIFPFMLDDSLHHDHLLPGDPSDHSLLLAADASQDPSGASSLNKASSSQNPAPQEIFVRNSADSGMEALFSTDMQGDGEDCVDRIKMDVGYRIAFRTKTDLEVMDDGYKWRKYGKKRVKNSPNPRNYYRCSSGGCTVKKRVERDREDSRFVITTYEGMHNHQSPSTLCCTKY